MMELFGLAPWDMPRLKAPELEYLRDYIADKRRER